MTDTTSTPPPTLHQRRLLLRMFREGLTLAEAQRRGRVKTGTLGRWMREPGFRRRLRRALRAAAFQRDSALQCGAARAAELLVAAATGERDLPAAQHRAVVDLLKLAAAAASRPRRGAPIASAPAPHGDVDTDEREALEARLVG